MDKTTGPNRLTQEEIDAFVDAYRNSKKKNKTIKVSDAPEFSTVTFVLLMIFFFPAGLIYQSVILAKAQVSIARSLLEVSYSLDSEE